MQLTIWDYFSFIPLFYLLIVMLHVRDKFYRYLFILAITLMVSIELFKRLSEPFLDTYPWLKRPDGAKNCNCRNTGGDVSGKPGFPSGHVATVCFLLVSIFVHVIHNNSHPILISIWGLYAMIQIFFVALSRIKKNCHTRLQTVAGGFIGLSCGALYSIYMLQ
jgi:hypothetical protein